MLAKIQGQLLILLSVQQRALAESQSSGLHQLRKLGWLHYVQPLTTTTFSKPSVRSKVIDKCCPVKADLFMTGPDLSGILRLFLSFIFFLFFQESQKAISERPFIRLQETQLQVSMTTSTSGRFTVSRLSCVVQSTWRLFFFGIELCCDVLFN